jgi:formylglycine-generating enzyme required for sulfatase activity
VRFVCSFLLLNLGVFAQEDHSSGGTAPGRRALLIANSDYEHLPTLRAPKSNAKALEAVLAAVHFQLEVVSNLTQEKMIDAIRKFASGVKPGDFVLIYFSGYSYQAEDHNYLLPTSFNPSDDSSPGLKAVNISFLETQLDQRKAGTRMLILDASRPLPNLPEGLVQEEQVKDTLICFSAAPNTAVPDPPDGGVNPFTAALISAIQEPGSTPDLILRRTQFQVDRNSGGRQTPWFTPMPVESFYFIEPTAIPPPKPVIVEVAPKPKPGEVRTNIKDNLSYAWIPDGSFEMGCVEKDRKCGEDEYPRHLVTMTNGFWITTTEIPVEAYDKFSDATERKKPRRTKTNLKGLASNLPATEVSWQDAQDYCAWAGGDRGRLPSEAEWEYAARGGKDGSIYPWGNEFDSEQANSFGKSRRKGKYPDTTPVGHYGANGFHLFDIIGNVREWTLDVYDPQAYQRPGQFVDPVVIKGVKDEHVLRGGAFDEKATDLRISAREHRPRDSKDNKTGFRCVALGIP